MLVQPGADGLGVDVRLGDAGGFPAGMPSSIQLLLALPAPDQMQRTRR